MAVSLSKSKGFPVMVVKSGKDKGKKYRINLDHTSDEGEPIKKYNKGRLQLIPNGKSREVHLVTGPSGSGKSYWASNYIKEYKKKFPKNEVYLISPKDEDESLDRLNVHRLKLSPKYWLDGNNPTLEEFEDSLVIFDDCEAIGDKNIYNAVNTFKDQILLQGRSLNISIIVITHLLMNYKESRVQNSECHTLTFFPSAGSNYHLKTYMMKHVGIPRQKCEELLAIPSRHVTLHRCFPTWVMADSLFQFL